MNSNMQVFRAFCAFAATLFWSNAMLGAQIDAFAPPTYRGKVILVVDKSAQAGGNSAIGAKLNRWTADLVSEGWHVLRHDVDRGPESPKAPAGGSAWSKANAPRVREVRSLIQADYDAAPGEVKLVFLVGHVPTPYSGDIFNHMCYQGAHPVDTFYGDMESPIGPGGWTDCIIDHRNIGHTRDSDDGSWPCYGTIPNDPGDGKFDQFLLPSALPLNLGVGRLDMSTMPSYPAEATILSHYFDKDHDYRWGNSPFPIQQRGICCSFDGNGTIGWDLIFADIAHLYESWQWFANTSAEGQDYALGAALSSSGNPHVVNGILCTAPQTPDSHCQDNNFITGNSRVAFYITGGCVQGIWDLDDDITRAALANDYDPLNGKFGLGLCCVQDFHHLYEFGLGLTIGEAEFLNYTGTPEVPLMGDPTLRLHTVRPPSNLAISLAATTATLTWNDSPDTSTYNIYRAPSPDGPYFLVNSEGPVSASTYVANRPSSGAPDNFYMVRSVKTQTINSGDSYVNLSEGAVIKVTGATTPYLAILAEPIGRKTTWEMYGVANAAAFAVDAVGCDSAGSGHLTYQWYKNGVAIVPGANARIQGADSRALLITALQDGDAGTYSVHVVCGTLTADSTAAELVLSATPHAANDEYTIHRNSPANLDVLSNDSDPENDPLLIYSASPVPTEVATVTITTDPQTGQQQLHFVPAQKYLGTITFTNVITDGGSTAEATVTVHVIPTAGNTAPEVSSIGAQSLNPGTTAEIPFMISDDISAADDLAISAVSSDGTIIPQDRISITRSGSTCVLHLTAGTARAGTASVTLNVTDEDQAVSSQTFEVSVRGTAVVPSPSNAVFTPAGAFEFSISGAAGHQMEIYRSTDLQDWEFVAELAPAAGNSTFTDSTVAAVAHRFYRVGNGTAFSQAIGFVRVTVPANGYALIANQLYGAKNTLNSLFRPAMPDGTTLPNGFQIKKWNGAAYVDYTWTAGSPGSWSPNGDLTLLPGEGVGAYNPTASAVTLTFAGLVPDGNLANPAAKGSQICSSILPRAGAVTAALGFPPEDGDQIQIYRNGMTVYSYDGDAQMWLPTEPVVEVGEAFWLRAVDGKNWMQEYSPAPVVKAHVAAAHFISSSEFGFAITAPSAGRYQVYKSGDLTSWTLMQEVTLTTAPTAFSDNTVSGQNRRFYRVGNGFAYSQPIGFVRVSVPANGYAAVADQLYAPRNTLNALFSPAMADGTTLPSGFQIKKWNGTAYVDYTWTAGSPGAWSPNGDATLLPGEGAMAYNPNGTAQTLTFAGLVADGHLPNAIRKGTHMGSSIVPRAGTITTALGFPPEDGDQIQLYHGGMSVYIFDGIDQLWSPTEPEVEVGEAFLVNPINGKNWIQGFSPTPIVAKATVDGAHFISGNEFGFTIAAPVTGPYQVYQSSDLASWTFLQEVTLTSDSVAFSDNTVSGENHRYYRVGNGYTFSQAIGFVHTAVPANGYALVANQLYGAKNTLDALFNPAMPGGTTLPSGFQIKTWNGSALVDYTWTAGSPGSWSPNGEATLLPGEGVGAYNPTASAVNLTFAGLVADGHLPNPVVKGLQLCSSILPRAGAITSALGYPPEDGDQIQLYRNGMTVYSYDGDAQMWLPTEPAIEVGESFWVRPIEGKNWIQEFSPAQVEKARVDSARFISGSEFGFTITAPGAGRYQVYKSGDLTSWTLMQDVTLAATRTAFSDNTISGQNRRFYRVGNGITYSQPIGFVRVSVPANGYALVADQLYAPRNTLDALFNPAIADGTSLPTGFQIKKWNGSGYVDYIWTAGSPGSWSPNGDTTLTPGEGALAYNPTASAATLAFAGLVADGHLPSPVQKGTHIGSSITPQSGAITTILGFPPEDGDQIQSYHGGMSTYTFDVYAQTWLPTEPIVEAGEAFIIRALDGKNWINAYPDSP